MWEDQVLLSMLFPTKFYCTSLSLFSFICSLQEIALFVCAPFVVGTQADYCCKIHHHHVLFFIFPYEVPVGALGSGLALLHSNALVYKVTLTPFGLCSS